MPAVDAEPVAVVQRLHRHPLARITAGPHQRVGPFTVAFDRHSPNPYLNYALPDPGAEPRRSEVDDLVAWFRRRGRQPRAEYLPSVSPAVEPALAAAGFAVELRPPLMVRRPGRRQGVPVPAGIELAAVAAASAEDVAGAALVAHVAFDEPGAPTADDLDRLAAMLAGGGRAVVARDVDGQPVGSARMTPVVEGMAEVVGVAVAAGYRRRGIATALVSLLVDGTPADALSLAWLSPGDGGAEEAYRRAGFAAVAGAVHLRIP